MASERFLKGLARATGLLSVLAVGSLIFVYACDTSSVTNKFQAWSSLGICVASFVNARRELRRRREKPEK